MTGPELQGQPRARGMPLRSQHRDGIQSQQAG